LSDLYKSTPPDIVLWSKEGIEKSAFHADAQECGALYGYASTVRDGLDANERCMLDKGYCFTNVVKLSVWKNYCSERPEGPACKSRGQRICPPALKKAEDFQSGADYVIPSDPKVRAENARLADELVKKRLSGQTSNNSNGQTPIPIDPRTITPSADQTMNLQNKVQQDSNSQMNDLLRDSIIRK
jgi:hypothetical protein